MPGYEGLASLVPYNWSFGAQRVGSAGKTFVSNPGNLCVTSEIHMVEGNT